MEVSWRIIRDEGTDALTLGHLAEVAGVTKPVVYDHFGTRNGLLLALYRAYDDEHTAVMEAEIAASGEQLQDKAAAIASAYVDCVLTQGAEITDVIAALAGAPELEAVKRACLAIFMEKCRAHLAPFVAGDISPAGLWAFIGAAEALSKAAAIGDIPPAIAKSELTAIILSMVERRS